MDPVKIIPCLDIKDGRVVKGVKFKELQDVDDPVSRALLYAEDGADELVFLDVSATAEERENSLSFLQSLSPKIQIPITVGGGIQSVEAARKILEAGADKICVASAAVERPELICELVEAFGKDHVMVAIDTQKSGEGWYEVYTKAGSVPTGLHAVSWAKEVEELGAGEIMLNSMDQDGEQKGFDLELIRLVLEAVHIPVIASGGAGSMEDFYEAYAETGIRKLLGASVFHFDQVKISKLKEYLSSQEERERDEA